MLKEQKNQVFVFGIVAILCISLTTPVAKAALDIDYICITSSKGFLDGTPGGWGPWLASFWAYVVDPGTLDHIDITKPGDSLPFDTMYQDEEDPSRWDASQDDFPSASLADLREDYPEGIYTFDFCEENGTVFRTVSLDYSGISEPTNPVNFIYPDYGQTGIPINPTITWTVDSIDGDALNMELGEVTGTAFYRFDSASITTTSWTPGPLLHGREYELSVSVINVKDLQSGPAFPTMTVDGDEFQYSLIIEYQNGIEFTTSERPELTISIDIKPGSYPNSINPKAGGVIPVAILTTDTFDASTVDPETVALECVLAKEKGKSGKKGSMEDVDGDSDLDLVVQIPNTINWADDATEATLTGETIDGIPIQGTDTVNIVPKGGKK